MKNMFKKSLAAVMAVASLAVGMTGVSASAYTSKANWSLFMVKSNSSVPGQVWSCTRSFPAYSGGYQTDCTKLYGSNDCYVDVTSNVGLSWIITSTGKSDIYYSSNGGTAKFTFTAVSSDTLTGEGTIGYNI